MKFSKDFYNSFDLLRTSSWFPGLLFTLLFSHLSLFSKQFETIICWYSNNNNLKFLLIWNIPLPTGNNSSWVILIKACFTLRQICRLKLPWFSNLTGQVKIEKNQLFPKPNNVQILKELPKRNQHCFKMVWKSLPIL